MMNGFPMDLFTLLILVGAVVLSLFIVVWPVQWAAKAMGARRTGFGWCLLSLIAALILQGLGSTVPVAGNLVALLLAALAFAGILETNYLRGIGIALLHLIFTVLLLLAFALVLSLVGIAGFA